jgi:hypothetical protein
MKEWIQKENRFNQANKRGEIKMYKIREKSIAGGIIGTAPLSLSILGLLLANMIFGIFGI